MPVRTHRVTRWSDMMATVRRVLLVVGGVLVTWVGVALALWTLLSVELDDLDLSDE